MKATLRYGFEVRQILQIRDAVDSDVVSFQEQRFELRVMVEAFYGLDYIVGEVDHNEVLEVRQAFDFLDKVLVDVEAP